MANPKKPARTLRDIQAFNPEAPKPARKRKAAKPVLAFWCCIHKSGEVWGDLDWTKAQAVAMAADFNGRVVEVEVRR